MIVHTKYSVGDQVYVAHAVYGTRRETCQDCDGKGEFPVEGKDFAILCPTCCGAWDEKRGWRDVAEWQPKVELLTIGQVRVQIGGGEDRISYMCRETGVGSGAVWNEEDLLPSRDLADKRAAQRVAAMIEQKRQEAEEERDRKLKQRSRKKAKTHVT